MTCLEAAGEEQIPPDVVRLPEATSAGHGDGDRHQLGMDADDGL